MANKEISKTDWDTIVDAINTRSCVPFLGAGVNLSNPPAYEGLPLAREVAIRLTGAVSKQAVVGADRKPGEERARGAGRAAGRARAVDQHRLE